MTVHPKLHVDCRSDGDGVRVEGDIGSSEGPEEAGDVPP